ncbi:hypothetical protein MXB_2364 [Myxobolus squamalis]|nr:hypothetical protein MXB_2364 [Myxobolus squamalis]
MRLDIATNRTYFVDHIAKKTLDHDPRFQNFFNIGSPLPTNWEIRISPSQLPFFVNHNPPGCTTYSVRLKEILLNVSEILASNSILALPSMDLHRRLYFSFPGEEGLDYGGMAREWFYLISHEISNPMYCLFKTSASDNYSIQINPNSSVNPDHLSYFHFVGRILAMALFHHSFIDGGFDSNFYKQILGRRRTMEDLKMTDIDIYNSLTWIW